MRIVSKATTDPMSPNTPFTPTRKLTSTKMSQIQATVDWRVSPSPETVTKNATDKVMSKFLQKMNDDGAKKDIKKMLSGSKSTHMLRNVTMLHEVSKTKS